jgi:hypothetical protein
MKKNVLESCALQALLSGALRWLLMEKGKVLATCRRKMQRRKQLAVWSDRETNTD